MITNTSSVNRQRSYYWISIIEMCKSGGEGERQQRKRGRERDKKRARDRDRDRES